MFILRDLRGGCLIGKVSYKTHVYQIEWNETLRNTAAITFLSGCASW